MKTIAISIGDVNGVGCEILLKAHKTLKKIINPLYVVDKEVLESSAGLLNIEIPKDLMCFPLKPFVSLPLREKILNDDLIKPSVVSEFSGEYSFVSFTKAVDLAINGEVDGILTLPINKYAWSKAGVKFLGHTEYLSNRFQKKAIMMLGCKEMFVALFTDHIPLNQVSKAIVFEDLVDFLLDFHSSFAFKKAFVLGLNPHAGDGGILGSEDFIIKKAIDFVNSKLDSIIFVGPISPDSAFSSKNRLESNIFIAMYHDQGLSPLKALYFEKSINVSLGLPILRASVDHGTGFDIAYNLNDFQKTSNVSVMSYIEGARFLANS